MSIKLCPFSHKMVAAPQEVSGSFHAWGMAQYERDIMFSAEIGNPVPGKDALYGHDDIFTKGGYDLEEQVAVGRDVFVELDLTSAIKEADIHFFGMKVDSATKFVLLGVKSHTASSFLVVMVLG